MIGELSPNDFPHDVELGLEPDPCGERFLGGPEPEIVQEVCALPVCEGAVHYHCLGCDSVACEHIYALVARLMAR
jgi:hypothetical protein